MIVLIDADILVYQAGYAAETGVAWDEDTFAIQANLCQGIEELDAMVAGIVHATDADKALLCLSCPTPENFRRDIYPAYKEPRTDPTKRTAKPILYKSLRDHVRSKYQVREKPRMEADDVLGILATMPGALGRRIIASIDKDLLTVPGFHYNWRNGEDGVFEVTESYAALMFYTQVLTGDSTDNYPGLPGIGPKRAAKLLDCLETEHAMWDAVVSAYEKRGLTEDDALVQARCARILRAEDYDFEKKEIKLWTPPAQD